MAEIKSPWGSKDPRWLKIEEVKSFFLTDRPPVVFHMAKNGKVEVERNDDNLIDGLRRMEVVSDKKTIFRYSFDLGIYEELNEDQTIYLINVCIHAYDFDAIEAGTSIPSYSVGTLKAIYLRLKAALDNPALFEPTPELVEKYGLPFEYWPNARIGKEIIPDPNKVSRCYVVNNGILKFNAYEGTTELLPHTPDVFTTHRLDIDWIGDQEEPEIFPKTRAAIRTILGDNDEVIRTFYRMIAYGFFTPNLEAGALLQISGRGGTGKSILTKPILTAGGRYFEDADGQGLAVSMSPDDINDRFEVTRMRGRAFAIFDDTDTDSKDERSVRIKGAKIKELSSGDKVKADVKHKAAGHFVNRALMVFLSNNHHIDYGSNDSGARRRLYPIRMDGRPLKEYLSVDEINELHSVMKTREAASCLFIDCWDEYVRMKPTAFVPPVEDIIEEWRSESLLPDSICEWRDSFGDNDSLRIYLDGKEMKVIYDEYKDFMREQGEYDVVPRNTFYDAIRDNFNMTSERKNTRGLVRRCFHVFKMKD